jgi:hypothetical protein
MAVNMAMILTRPHPRSESAPASASCDLPAVGTTRLGVGPDGALRRLIAGGSEYAAFPSTMRPGSVPGSPEKRAMFEFPCGVEVDVKALVDTAGADASGGETSSSRMARWLAERARVCFDRGGTGGETERAYRPGASSLSSP